MEREASVPQSQSQTVQDASDIAINVAATAPGKIRVIKRNGTVVDYDDSKISVAITAVGDPNRHYFRVPRHRGHSQGIVTRGSHSPCYTGAVAVNIGCVASL